MALFVNQENTRSKLQERLAAELSEKAKKRAQDEAADLPDGVTDSNYLKDTKQTTSLAWVWAIVGVLAIGVVIYFVIQSS
jgi:hypothetical protein